MMHCNVDPFRETSKAGYDPGTRNKVRGFLVQDDARPHSADIFSGERGGCVCKSIIRRTRRISILQTSSHSHDSNPLRKGKRFEEIPDVRQNVTPSQKKTSRKVSRRQLWEAITSKDGYLTVALKLRHIDFCKTNELPSILCQFPCFAEVHGNRSFSRLGSNLL